MCKPRLYIEVVGPGGIMVDYSVICIVTTCSEFLGENRTKVQKILDKVYVIVHPPTGIWLQRKECLIN